MKKFVKEKYADMLLQICTDYVNRYPASQGRLSQAVNRALETLDKYSYYILGMGYMLYVEDIKYLREYISGIDSPENKSALEELDAYLATLEK
ncbi:MAG: hypothetical protein IKJ05_04155 [Oscillospiraceae bacterium]|nr:hypothetical protein [Oscillospiraceae bacterium]